MTSQCVELQAVHLSQPLHPRDVVVHHVVAPEVAHVLRSTPASSIEREIGVQPLRLAHHPPSVSALEVGIAAPMAMRGHGALRGVAIARNLGQQGANRSAEHRLIHHFHDLRAPRFGIVLEQYGRRTTAIDNPDAIKLLAAASGADVNGLCSCLRGNALQNEDGQHGEHP